MAIGCLILGVFLVIGAIAARGEGRGMVIFLLLCAALNFAAATDMMATEYPYAWQLAPGVISGSDPGYHQRR